MSGEFLAYLVELEPSGRLVVNGVALQPGPYHATDARDDGEARIGYALREVSAYSAGRDPREPPIDVTVKDRRPGGLGVHRFGLPPQAVLSLADLREPLPPPPPPPVVTVAWAPTPVAPPPVAPSWATTDADDTIALPLPPEPAPPATLDADDTVALPIPAEPEAPKVVAPVRDLTTVPSGPIRPKLIEFVPNPRPAETRPTSAPEAEPAPASGPAPPAVRRRGRRAIVVTVVVLLAGVGVTRAVLAARVVHDYTAVCVDLRTQQRTPIERCALAGQNAYRHWYIAAGNRIPAVGEAPQSGGTDTPTGRKVRITEDFAVEGGVFDPKN